MSGAFSWTPTYSQAGTHTVTVRVDDDNGGSDSEDITITVNKDTTLFVTTWATTTANESITIPGTGTYAVTGATGPRLTGTALRRTSTPPRTYAVSISGGLTRITLATDTANAAKLQSIEQWGDIEWSSMNGAFHGATNMVYRATDASDLSGVTDMSGMFSSASCLQRQHLRLGRPRA